MNIVVLDGYTLNPGDNSWDGVSALGDLTVYDRTPAGKILERAAGAEVLLTNKTPITRETIAALPRLRFIAVLATGYNVVDTAAARERGISVSNVPVYGTDTVAQHTVALILELCNRVGLHDAAVQAGEWAACPDFCFWKTPLVELMGKTLGVVGFGRIGQRVAGIARAFGMRIIYFRRPGSTSSFPHARGVTLEELAAESDVITLHCPLFPENAGFVNESFLRSMKRTAVIVNASRGPLINETDLASALKAGTIAGAALDVVSKEPPSAGNPLFGLGNCIITPHIAWAGLDARRSLMRTTVENVQAYLQGSPVNVVNP